MNIPEPSRYLEEKFHTLLESHRIGHFYILHTEFHHSYLQKISILKKWADRFIEEYYLNSHTTLPLKDHPDIFSIIPREGLPSPYLVTSESIKDFLKFKGLRPFELKHRFVFFHCAENMTAQLCNKLLKTLESPPEKITFFFMVSVNKRLLPTIESRAIRLLVKTQSPYKHFHPLFNLSKAKITEERLKKFLKTKTSLRITTQRYFLEAFLSPKGYTPLIEELKNSPREMRMIIELLSSIYLTNKSSYLKLDQYFTDLQWFQKGEIYRTAIHERLYALLNTAFN